MAWDPAFRSALRGRSGIALGVGLEVVLPAAGGVGQGWRAGTDPRATTLDAGIEVHPTRGLQVQLGPVGVQLQTWAYQAGAFSVVVVIPDGVAPPSALFGGASRASTPARLAAQALRQGAICELKLGIDGAAWAEYQPLRLGRIQQVKALDWNKLQIECWDITTVLKSRLSTALPTSSQDSGRLFYASAYQGDTLAADWTTGVSTSLVLTGAHASRFVKPTGGTGAVKVQASSGSWFYLTWTGTSGASTLTGVSTSGAFGTTSSTVLAGSAIRSVVHMSGHPSTLTQRVLASTGAGTNGTHDVFPVDWGFALDRRWLDDDGFRQVLQVASISGSYTWTWLVEAEQEDGGAWLTAQLAESGMWLCGRQGQISLRAADDLGNPTIIADEITDADLDDRPGEPALLEVSWYDPGSPYSYPTVKVYYATAAGGIPSSTESNEEVNALPRRARLEYETNNVLTSADIAAETRDRLAPYGHRPAEIVTLPLRGLGYGWCPGDIVTLTTQRARGRFASTVGGYAGRPALVMELSEDLRRNRTVARVAVTALDHEDDHG